MDIGKMLESDFLSSQFVKDSKTKLGVIISAGTEETVKGSKGDYVTLKLMIEIDGKQKFWKLNKPSMKALATKYGNETQAWMGKQVIFSTALMQNGKEGVLGNPV